jgi:GNAT superfamily N-acetyltransferase
MTIAVKEAGAHEAALLAGIIRDSFRDVAERFGLTPENCPAHPSNCTEEWVTQALAKGVSYYLLTDDGRPVGCVALECVALECAAPERAAPECAAPERASGELGYLERLSVLPAHRRRGFGRALVEHVRAEAKRRGLRRLQVGIIADHARLREWYERLGFLPTGTKRFAHLPFEVLFMTADV